MSERMYSVDGLNVHVRGDCPPGGGRVDIPPTVFLHGFTGSSKSWEPIWERLRAASLGSAFYAPDVVGHGRTDAPQSVDRYTMTAAALDLARLLDLMAETRVDLVGYSMGGRLALHFAAAYPERVRRLVLEGATPGIENEHEREERTMRDTELAAWIETHGIAAFVERWEALPLFSTQQKLPANVREAQRIARLGNRPHGLANSLRGMGTGAQDSLWHRLDSIKAKTLLIAGEADEKFRAIAHKMRPRLPDSRVVIAPGAGHNVHLESPDFFADVVSAFLSDETTRKAVS